MAEAGVESMAGMTVITTMSMAAIMALENEVVAAAEHGAGNRSIC